MCLGVALLVTLEVEMKQDVVRLVAEVDATV
jgi:hypothetical protein